MRAEAAMGSPNDESLSELKWIVAVLAGAGLLWLGTGAFMTWNDRRIDETARGKLLFAHRVQLTGDRPGLLLVEEVLHSGGDAPDTTSGRLDVVDPASGRRLARAIQVTARDCHGAGPGRAWCDDRAPEPPEDRGLVLRELAGLQVVASHAQLKQAVPAYAKGIARTGASVFVDGTSGAVVAPMNDGTTWRIDPADCPVCRASEAQARARFALSWRFGSSQYGTVPGGRVGGRDLLLTRGPRQALAVRTGMDETPLGPLTFLDAGLLADTDTADQDPMRPMVLDGDGLVVVHTDTLDSSSAKTELTALDAAGAARWHAALGRGTVVASWRFRSDGLDVLVVAVQADESWLEALDAQSGRRVWRYDI